VAGERERACGHVAAVPSRGGREELAARTG